MVKLLNTLSARYPLVLKKDSVSILDLAKSGRFDWGN
jgi:hypothetical protein